MVCACQQFCDMLILLHRIGASVFSATIEPPFDIALSFHSIRPASFSILCSPCVLDSCCRDGSTGSGTTTNATEEYQNPQ